MIPKIVHYIWVGADILDDTGERCVATWEDHLGDYEFMFWGDSAVSLYVDECAELKKAHEEGRWGVVSDILRLFILRDYGGIYLDTDVMVMKSFDSVLEHEAFVGYQFDDMDDSVVENGTTVKSFTLDGFGYSKEASINNAVIGSVPNGEFITAYLGLMVSNYQQKPAHRLPYSDIGCGVFALGRLISGMYGDVLDGKERDLGGVYLYSSEFFYPLHILKDGRNIEGNLDRLMFEQKLYHSCNENTYSVHLFCGRFIK